MGADKGEECQARLATLSERERAVLDHSLTGRTDEQIAQSLGLSIATISTYWARIRGKLGHLSRTELVSMVLRHEANQERARLVDEIQILNEQIQRQQIRESLRDLLFEDGSESTWHLKALDRSPDATLVITANSDICFANVKAHELFRSSGQDIRGIPIRDLTVPSSAGGRDIEPCRSLLIEGSLVERETLGIEHPFYGRRRDGTNFRAVLQAQRFSFRDQFMAILIVREHLSEAELVLQALHGSPGTDVPEGNALIIN